MVRRSGYGGVADPELRFNAMRSPIARLRARELAQPRPSPAGAALDHAIVSVRMAANLLTRRSEFFDLYYRPDDDAYVQVLATFEALRPTLQELRRMGDAYHPATPESRALNHAAEALRMAADTLTGRSDFYRLIAGDGTSPARREP
jgi:hypothetical protein